MIVQADEYERAQGKRLQSFFTYTQESFTHPEILGWANELRDERYNLFILYIFINLILIIYLFY